MVLVKLQQGSFQHGLNLRRENFEHGQVRLLGNEFFEIMVAGSSLAIGKQSFDSSALRSNRVFDTFVAAAGLAIGE
ncbi:hypothetical protein C9974_15725 [Marinobacter sp. B9-2]|nr:hypothetical protein C9974_15725 [Marinobacter sp. B9-2]